MKKIEVLGSGCAKCKQLEMKVRELSADNDIEANIVKVSDIKEIMKYGILSTPGLVVDGEVKWSGSIPKDEQILAWLKG